MVYIRMYMILIPGVSWWDVVFWYAVAPDAKERQKWITHLRAAVSRVSNHHTSTPHDTSPVNTPMTSLTPAAPAAAGTTGDDDQMEHLALQRTPSKRTSLTRLFKTTKNTINRWLCCFVYTELWTKYIITNYLSNELKFTPFCFAFCCLLWVPSHFTHFICWFESMCKQYNME